MNHPIPPQTTKKSSRIGRFLSGELKLSNVLLFIGGVATAFFIGYQWKEMRKASGDAEKAIELNRQQLAAMQTQSDVMRGQLDEMKQTRTLDERAWVVASDVTMGPPEDGFMKFNVTFKNSGKTPAINTQIKIFSNADIKAITTKDDPQMPQLNMAMVAPNGSNFTFINEPIGAMKAVGAFYLYGTAWYDDIFGKHHWSQFCYVVNCDTNLNIEVRPAGVHNTCDDAATNQTN